VPGVYEQAGHDMLSNQYHPTYEKFRRDDVIEQTAISFSSLAVTSDSFAAYALPSINLAISCI
jgi:hypothetical protein